MIYNAIFKWKAITMMAFLFTGLTVGAPMDPHENTISHAFSK